MRSSLFSFQSLQYTPRPFPDALRDVSAQQPNKMALVPVPVTGAGLLSGVAMLGMARAGKRWREARQRK